MNKILVIAVCALAATPALAQSVAEKTGVNSVIGRAPTTADFVREAAISDMFEIQSSQLATQKADAPTQAFAQKMITDHTKTSGELTTMETGKSGVVIPTSLDSSHQKMLDSLKGLNGADFTKRYHSQQVSAHKDAVSLFQRYAKGGSQPDLKSWAGTTEPTLEQHLKMAQDLDK